MGDRIIITFHNPDRGTRSSPLYSHWGGLELLQEAKRYLSSLDTDTPAHETPLDRKEPDALMADFIGQQYLTYNIDGSLPDTFRLMPEDEVDAMYTDRGHWWINTITWATQQQTRSEVATMPFVATKQPTNLNKEGKKEYTDTAGIWERTSKEGKNYLFLRVTKDMPIGDYVAFRRENSTGTENMPNWSVSPSKPKQ